MTATKKRIHPGAPACDPLLRPERQTALDKAQAAPSVHQPTSPFGQDGVLPVKELLLPDRASWWDDPIMEQGLRPLADFDHPQLRCVDAPEYEDQDPIGSLATFMGKNCAGLQFQSRDSRYQLVICLVGQ